MVNIWLYLLFSQEMGPETHRGAAGGFLGQFGRFLACCGNGSADFCPVQVITMTELSWLHYCKYKCKKHQAKCVCVCCVASHTDVASSVNLSDLRGLIFIEGFRDFIQFLLNKSLGTAYSVTE
jgi:hypothetical protein